MAKDSLGSAATFGRAQVEALQLLRSE